MPQHSFATQLAVFGFPGRPPAALTRPSLSYTSLYRKRTLNSPNLNLYCVDMLNIFKTIIAVLTSQPAQAFAAVDSLISLGFRIKFAVETVLEVNWVQNHLALARERFVVVHCQHIFESDLTNNHNSGRGSLPRCGVLHLQVVHSDILAQAIFNNGSPFEGTFGEYVLRTIGELGWPEAWTQRSRAMVSGRRSNPTSGVVLDQDRREE